MDRATTGQVAVVQARAPAPRLEFRTVFQEHFAYVWNSLRHFGVRANDLEDLTHEVFLRVHERFDECDTSRPLRPWLFAFAYRVAAAHRRLARHRVEVMRADIDAAAETAPADHVLMQREDRELALGVLQAIALDRRAVFILHDIDGVPIPEVAEALQMPVNTAYSRLRLARMECHAAVRRLRRARGER
ncbi:MAG: RNA polymerase sigma factor [Myxococcales bacterium]|nr:RNA polymerase sigma factor [Myxococcales bacterium]